MTKIGKETGGLLQAAIIETCIIIGFDWIHLFLPSVHIVLISLNEQTSYCTLQFFFLKSQSTSVATAIF